MNIPQELIDKVHDRLVLLWAERIPQLATLDEAEKQERIMAQEIIELVLGLDTITSQGDTLVLTRKEVREARERQATFGCFLAYTLCLSCINGQDLFGICHLCKRLTEFASQGDSKGKGKGEEDESTTKA